ncbi:unnamed protein product, partial [Arabidopsis halleri]
LLKHLLHVLILCRWSLLGLLCKTGWWIMLLITSTKLLRWDKALIVWYEW